MRITQEYQNLNLMAADIFGGGDVKAEEKEPQPKIVQTEEDMMQFMKAFQ